MSFAAGGNGKGIGAGVGVAEPRQGRHVRDDFNAPRVGDRHIKLPATVTATPARRQRQRELEAERNRALGTVTSSRGQKRGWGL